jgi:hypothetical protein
MSYAAVDADVREEETHYLLPLVGREVDQLCFDYGVTLVVEGTDTIRLETPFTVHLAGQTVVVDPERLETAAVLLSLFRAVVTRAEAGKDGSLVVEFDDDRWLRAEAISDGEAWEIGGGLPPVTPSYRLVSLPGGGIHLGD